LSNNSAQKKILVIQSADIQLVRHVIVSIRNNSQLQNARVVLFCRSKEDSLAYAKQALESRQIDEYIVHDESHGAAAHLRRLRRYHFHLCALIINKDPSYRKVLLFTFLLGIKNFWVFDALLRPSCSGIAGLFGRLFDGRMEKLGFNGLPTAQHTAEVVTNKAACYLIQDFMQLGVAAVTAEIDRLKHDLRQKNLQFTSWMGDFENQRDDAETCKLWENAWMVAKSGVSANSRVLDAGGASTIFSFYLASKGCEVSVIDIDWLGRSLIENAVAVASAMNWKMDVRRGDITAPLPYSENYFDFIFCICVLEHMVSVERRKAIQNLVHCLKPGGILGLTMDYDFQREGDKGLRFREKTKLYVDIIEPSGLTIYGNRYVQDPYDDKYFLGSLFFKKPDSSDSTANSIDLLPQ
jgi:SAM-dependent methyltransferase